MAKEETKTETKTTAAKVTATAQRRVRMDTSNMKSAYCNFFAAQANPNEVVLNFGYNQSLGSTQRDVQVQMLQQVILHPATARRVKDTLVALFQKRDAPRVRAGAASDAPKKAS
jgi:glutathione synthase/RimK-type ligase-like ATP-grasp enzyme